MITTILTFKLNAMKFNLKTSGYFYHDPKERNKLEYLGFYFEKTEYGFAIRGTPEIEINSLEELIAFSEKYGRIILDDGTIEIYDDDRE